MGLDLLKLIKIPHKKLRLKTQWRIQGTMVRPPPWSDRKFLDNFCTVFVSRLNRKMRVPKLLVTVRVFCLLTTASKCTQTYHFEHNFFLGRGPAPTTPHTLDAYRASPLLAEILNTPLLVVKRFSVAEWPPEVTGIGIDTYNSLITACTVVQAVQAVV